VATSALFVGDEVAGIWFVATMEAFQRRGIGQAMTAHALREATRLGSDLAHLEAEANALRLHERIGFQVVARYAEYQAPG
jgi:ribosomal protein S18 acetylase RimI-like enzyme